MEKATDAFRTISETAEDLDLPQHVLRFWETKFSQIRPMKRGGGRRYYRPDDIELLRGIRYLLYGEGYTIKGVQRILKEQGVRFVMEAWRQTGDPTEAPLYAADDGDDRDSLSAEVDSGEDTGDEPASDEPFEPTLSSGERAPVERTAASPSIVVSPRSAPSAPTVDAGYGMGRHEEAGAPSDDEPLPAGILPEGRETRGGFKFMDRLRGAPEAGAGLSRDDVRRLQSTLFELLECKRLLDQTR